MNQYDLQLNGYDPYTDAGTEWIFDPIQARKPVLFVERYLSHVKGNSGPLLLSDWQKVFLANLYGWVSATDPSVRRYRFALLELSRKQGKSTLVGALLLTELFLSPEVGQEIYLAANTRDQAGLVFEIVAGMLRNNPELKAKVKILDARKRILFPSTNSFVQCLSSDHASCDGLNGNLVLYDELHEAPTRDLFDKLKTCQGARKNPLFVVLSTPGHDRDSVMFEVHDEAIKARSGEWKNPRFLPAVFTTDPATDDWRLPETWHKACPNLGISVSEEWIAQECERAKRLPSYQTAFRRLYCSQWTEAATTWLDMTRYRANILDKLPPELAKRDTYAALDLSVYKDLSAFSLCIPYMGKTYFKSWGFLPEENIEDKEERDAKPYRRWAEQGWLFLTPGPTVDQAFIREHVLKIAREYNLYGIAYDQYNAVNIVKDLESEGLNMVKWGQSPHYMNSPLREFERLLIEGNLRFEPNPLLESCFGHASIVTNSDEHIRFAKPTDTARIDLAQAAIMAFGLQIVTEDQYSTGSAFFV